MRHSTISGARCRERCRVILSVVAIALAAATGARAEMRVPTTVAAMATSAERVFRGRCAAVRIATRAVAGARIPVTIYTFHASEYLKGRRRHTITFRQVGTANGGPRDLGRLAGLPVYAPGTEYVLFLLPPSGAGLTSPAGAAEGAYVVSDAQVRRLRGGVPAPRALPAARGQAAPPDAEVMSYQALRQAVREALAR